MAGSRDIKKASPSTGFKRKRNNVPISDKFLNNPTFLSSEKSPVEKATNSCLDSQTKQNLALQCIHEIISQFSSHIPIHSNIHTTHKSRNSNNDGSELIGLDSEFQELRHILVQSLLPISVPTIKNSNTSTPTSIKSLSSPRINRITNYMYNSQEKNAFGKSKNRNVAALIMGPRGHGKRTLLESVLTSIKKEADDIYQQSNLTSPLKSPSVKKSSKTSLETPPKSTKSPCSSKKQHFRVVRLNGLLLRNGNDAIAFREIIRQLTDIAAEEAHSNAHFSKNPDLDGKNVSGNSNSNSSTETNIHYPSTSSTNKPNSKDDMSKEPSTYDPNTNFVPQIANFSANIASLDDAFQRANVDGIPILIILYELDAFIASSSSGNSISSSSSGTSYFLSASSTKSRTHRQQSLLNENTNSEKQMLLYHLLDRVSSHHSNVSVVGVTNRLNTVDMFERRVKSRAQGNQCVIYLGHTKTFEDMIKIWMSKVKLRLPCDNRKKSKPSSKVNKSVDDWRNEVVHSLRQQFQKMLGLKTNNRNEIEHCDETKSEKKRASTAIRDILEKSWKLGKDLRWFSHVFFIVFSLVMVDYKSSLQRFKKRQPTDREKETQEDDLKPSLTYKHIEDALQFMGSGSNPSTATFYGSFGRTIPKEKQNSIIIQQQNNPINSSNPRIQALLDLPESQIAILLSIKRIMYKQSLSNSIINSKIDHQDKFSSFAKQNKDNSRHKKNAVKSHPIITFQHISDEYLNTFAKKQYKYMSSQTLFQAFIYLLETDLIKPVMDRSGLTSKKSILSRNTLGGMLQYDYAGSWTSCPETALLRQMPIHVTVDMDRELGSALKGGWLDCSTGLREWGLKMSSN